MQRLATGGNDATTLANIYFAADVDQHLRTRLGPTLYGKLIDDDFSVIPECFGTARARCMQCLASRYQAEISRYSAGYVCACSQLRVVCTSTKSGRLCSTYRKPEALCDYFPFESCNRRSTLADTMLAAVVRILRINNTQGSFTEQVRLFRAILHRRGYGMALFENLSARFPFSDKAQEVHATTSRRPNRAQLIWLISMSSRGLESIRWTRPTLTPSTKFPHHLVPSARLGIGFRGSPTTSSE
eukprot:7230477-Pyramimonas_sp.AAC.1